MFATKRGEPASEDVLEYWIRDIANPLDRSRFGVDASRFDASKSSGEQRWPWQVDVWAMGGIRDIPLEKELRRAIMKSLRAVPGVVAAREGDREFWIVRGNPTGDALVAAVAAVVDGYAGELRAYLR